MLTSCPLCTSVLLIHGLVLVVGAATVAPSVASQPAHAVNASPLLRKASSPPHEGLPSASVLDVKAMRPEDHVWAIVEGGVGQSGSPKHDFEATLAPFREGDMDPDASAESGFGPMTLPDFESEATPGYGPMGVETFNFNTGTGVRLRSASIIVRTPVGNFSPAGDVQVEGDPGWAATASSTGYKTLELAWFERDTQMRIYIYFESNTTHWWAFEVRTYNGKTSMADWLYIYGQFFTTPLGKWFRGTFDEVSTSDSYTGMVENGTLHMMDLRLKAFI